MEEMMKIEKKDMEEKKPADVVAEVEAYRAEEEKNMKEMAKRMATYQMMARTSVS